MLTVLTPVWVFLTDEVIEPGLKPKQKRMSLPEHTKKTRPLTQTVYVDSQIPSPSPTEEESVGPEQNLQ